MSAFGSKADVAYASLAGSGQLKPEWGVTSEAFEVGVICVFTVFGGFVLRTWFRIAGYRTSFWPALVALVLGSGWEVLNGGLARLIEHAPPLVCGFLASWAGMFLTRKRSWAKRDRYMPSSARRPD